VAIVAIALVEQEGLGQDLDRLLACFFAGKSSSLSTPIINVTPSAYLTPSKAGATNT